MSKTQSKPVSPKVWLVLVGVWIFGYDHFSNYVLCRTLMGWDGRTAIIVAGCLTLLILSALFYWHIKDRIPLTVASFRKQWIKSARKEIVPDAYQRAWIFLFIVPIVLVFLADTVWRDYKHVERYTHLDDAPVFKARQIEKCQARGFL